MSRYLLFPVLLAALLSISPASSQAGFLNDVMKNLTVPPAATAKLDDATVIKGLKEALATGTSKAIFAEFKPVVSSSLQNVGAVQSYRQMAESFKSIPFAGSLADADLDNYVTDKAVDGLFAMIGAEEKKIRTDPAARGTELLKKVFGK